MLPSDIDPDSRCRLPLPRREDLDEAGRAIFDGYTDPKGGTIRGLKGPGGIQLHSPRLSQANRPVNKYLRFESGLTEREREVAILITAREADSRFEWAAHEPEALRVGVPNEVVEAIKHRKPLEGLADEDSVIIQLGREAFGKRKVSSETYARALQRFGAPKLVNLVALMGNYASTAALLTVFDMQIDEGTTALLPID
ncbi:MAG: carboxymuconolactone decarboxylase [Hyphomicrobiales bacterium]|nr:carboxymuconolactone decarboxylase [Hyphomicrobiales bacterium]